LRQLNLLNHINNENNNYYLKDIFKLFSKLSFLLRRSPSEVNIELLECTQQSQQGGKATCCSCYEDGRPGLIMAVMAQNQILQGFMSDPKKLDYNKS